MILDEAIKHAEEVAEEQDRLCKANEMNYCPNCGVEMIELQESEEIE